MKLQTKLETKLFVYLYVANFANFFDGFLQLQASCAFWLDLAYKSTDTRHESSQIGEGLVLSSARASATNARVRQRVDHQHSLFPYW